MFDASVAQNEKIDTSVRNMNVKGEKSEEKSVNREFYFHDEHGNPKSFIPENDKKKSMDLVGVSKSEEKFFYRKNRWKVFVQKHMMKENMLQVILVCSMHRFQPTCGKSFLNRKCLEDHIAGVHTLRQCLNCG